MKQIPRAPRPPAPRSLASVALEAWLAETEHQQIDIAAKLGLSRARMSSYVRGIRVPLVNVATRLQRLSKGRVALADWRVAAE